VYLWSLTTLLYCEFVIYIEIFLCWYVYWSYFKFWWLPEYFPCQTFIPDVTEIPISLLFLELPFSISFSIKNVKTEMILPFSPYLLRCAYFSRNDYVSLISFGFLKYMNMSTWLKFWIILAHVVWNPVEYRLWLLYYCAFTYNFLLD
jgi:hypothetical protein